MARKPTAHCKIMSGYDCRNKCVFSLHRSIVSDAAVVMSSGSLFQSLERAVANDRSPTVTRRDGRTARWLEDDERRQVRGGMSPTDVAFWCSARPCVCVCVCLCCSVSVGVAAVALVGRPHAASRSERSSSQTLLQGDTTRQRYAAGAFPFLTHICGLLKCGGKFASALLVPQNQTALID